MRALVKLGPKSACNNAAAAAIEPCASYVMHGNVGFYRRWTAKL